jgi:tetratricopeptide (TPR) repeat protein
MPQWTHLVPGLADMEKPDMRTSLAWSLVLLSTLLAGQGAAATASLGHTVFVNSGAPEAQEAFTRAVLLLHSFEYEDAREAFQEAQALDEDFAMAYWGEAMTHNHPLWRVQGQDEALAALAGLGATPSERAAKAPTEREKGYLGALETLYGPGEKEARDMAYSQAMSELSERFPDDLDARAFYALSILGTAQGVRDFSIYMRAGAVAEEVFAANPDHPGAAHYLIHSYDDPVHAPLGLRAARVYARIAPAASHAQHMISHIYVALGQWPESVDANVKSFAVSVERRARKDQGVDALNYHSLQWLEYSYLQLGRFKEARSKLEDMTGYARESNSPRALWYHAAMRAAWIVETGGQTAPAEISPGETQVTGAAADLFASGYAALIRGDQAAARQAAQSLSKRHDSAASGHLCGQRSSYEETSRRDLIVAQVMQDSLLALIALEEGQTETALALLDKATSAEGDLPMEFGPPIIVKPSHELYGEVLLKLGRPLEARDMFQQALARAPRRSLALAGLARAARELGDLPGASSACAELASIYNGADEGTRRPAACAAPAPTASLR